MSTTLQIPSKDARQFDALYSAAADRSAPAIVLVQEIFGINHAMKEAVRDWSARGYHVIGPICSGASSPVWCWSPEHLVTSTRRLR